MTTSASQIAKPMPSPSKLTATLDAHKATKAAPIDEPRVAKKVDRFDVKGVGAPSPDMTGMIDDDDGAIDPATQLPTIPARTLQPRVKA